MKNTFFYKQVKIETQQKDHKESEVKISLKISDSKQDAKENNKYLKEEK